ncbi:1,4-dihydroxy-2-naphthoyl-CoA hydrolase [Dickeya dianthicola]|uniref:Hotdog fold thioesterase n=1 Tax=Dickeya dianthicola TaxID=204039 RepID=A0ABX9NKX3_9GAMM|nr:hotdog fold thioesterase [Dickeya dianthicola]AYC19919.1 1,4-dihydroxy-2-naphthoyl-CoA hydrolase [Dickeya dianthicola]MBI0438224.1 hotdog fold thioesterase [Dickeya dianthicola]MBI0448769.1 hotdog fold thioesterase [Dickeya dianthicola]MBI0453340.1 hotdog fold thioesterase [Dickeya dianthicola]MBI0457952.1 hotdog fold thioesterase [Dickeya dianthicola]
MIWKRATSLAALNQMGDDCMVSHLGICFTHMTDDSLEATLPVDARTRQPFGLLHGGASVVLAESLGSVAGWLCTEPGASVVGVEINASHLRALAQGEVRGICRPLHLGRQTQVWQIEIVDERQRRCCIARLTTAVIQP